MSEQKNQKLITILHYWDIRGIAQPIRNLLYYLDIPFIQKILDSQNINDSINDQFFNSGLPKIQYDGFKFSDVTSIVRYIVNRQTRGDLLGLTPQNQARINQIMSKYFVQKNKLIPFLINGVIEISKKQYKQKKPYGDIILRKFIQISKFSQACLIFSRGQNFVMNQITILDFFFYELCFYICNLFYELVTQDNQNFASFKNYKNMFQKTQFAIKNKQKMQNKQIFIPFSDKRINDLIQNVWAGPKQRLFS